MAETYHCVYCKLKKPGEWKIATHVGGFWNPTRQWVCIECGESKGETQGLKPQGAEVLMASQKPITRAITPGLPATSVSEARQSADKAMALVPTLQAKLEELVVQSDEDYQLADALLGQMNDLRKGWGGIWKRIQEKTIKPIRSGLEELYALDRHVDKPLEALATGIKAKMTGYQREKLRLQQAEDRRVQMERERLEREAEEKRKKAEQAATPQLRGRFEKQAEQLTQQALETYTEEPVTLATGTSSALRREKKVVVDLANLLVGIIEGSIPEWAVEVQHQKILKMWKEDPEAVAKWPGVSIVEDINVVSR